tara:strand:- start:34 stop:927 length:894 start_codon:yes stop_codon:yes gene_type:complete
MSKVNLFILAILSSFLILLSHSWAKESVYRISIDSIDKPPLASKQNKDIIKRLWKYEEKKGVLQVELISFPKGIRAELLSENLTVEIFGDSIDFVRSRVSVGSNRLWSGSSFNGDAIYIRFSENGARGHIIYNGTFYKIKPSGRDGLALLIETDHTLLKDDTPQGSSDCGKKCDFLSLSDFQETTHIEADPSVVLSMVTSIPVVKIMVLFANDAANDVDANTVQERLQLAEDFIDDVNFHFANSLVDGDLNAELAAVGVVPYDESNRTFSQHLDELQTDGNINAGRTTSGADVVIAY